MNCPVSGLLKVLKKLNQTVPKPKALGSFETIGITEEFFIGALGRLSQVTTWGPALSYQRMSDISVTGNRICNFLRDDFYREQTKGNKKEPRGSESFLLAACRTLDKIIMVGIDSATSTNELEDSMLKVREVLKSKSLFYGVIEDATHNYYPHRISLILSTNTRNDWNKLCPAFRLMDLVCDAIFPLYKTQWLKEHRKI